MAPQIVLVIFALSLSLTTVARRFKCEPLAVKICQDFGYSKTFFPNFLHHGTQQCAERELREFTHLIRTRCSKDLLFYLCTMYAPICSSILRRPILPCRSLCESAKNGCEQIMRRFHVPWPKTLSCDKLPKASNNTICVPASQTNAPTYTPLKKRRLKKKKKKRRKMNTRNKIGQKFRRCEEMASPMCRSLHYNMTTFPNLLNQDHQGEAYIEMQQFYPLITVNCSKHLLYFLCSLYFPRCKTIKSPIPPCRSLCESAKSPCCTQLLQRYNISWPGYLNCRNLPAPSSSKMCIGTSGKLMAGTDQPEPDNKTDQLSVEERKKKRQRKKKKNKERRKNKKGRKNRKRKNKKRRPKLFRKKACEM